MTFTASIEQPSEASATKPLPHAEQTARLSQIKTQFSGLKMAGVNEPAQTLFDECVFQFENHLIKIH